MRVWHATCMTRVFRTDYGALAAPVRQPNGSMLVEARIARSGVYVYRNADGTVRKEYRPEAEVSRADSRSSFRGAPVTNDHPPVMITNGNARQFAVGTVLDTPRMDGKFLVTALVIHDAATIAAMESGKVQCSAGYDCELIESPGVSPEGERYDAIQQAIRGNHLAIVDSGRAGSAVSVRMDAIDVPIGTCADVGAMQTSCLPMSDPNTAKDEALRSLEAQRLDATTRLDAALADAAAHKLRADTAEGQLIEIRKELEAANAKNAEASKAFETQVLATEKARADKAEAEIKGFESKFAGAVKDRVALERRAGIVLGPEARMDDMTDRQIRVAVISKLDSSADVSDGVADGVIIGRFLTMTDRHAATAREIAQVATITSAAQRKDSAPKKPAWMEPLPSNALKNASK